MNKLYRSRDTKVVAGVAGGIAEYFDIDPIIVRAVFVIAAFGWGFSFIAYIILWIIVPKRPIEYIMESDEKKNSDMEEHIIHEEFRNNGKGKIIFGIILICIGLLGLMKNVFPDIEFKIVFPILLIAIGFLILTKVISKPNKNGGEIL